MPKITPQKSSTVAETFAAFIQAKRAKGLVDKTINSYVHHFKAVSKHLDVEQDIVNLCRPELDSMVASMRAAGLSANSINSYRRMERALKNILYPSFAALRRSVFETLPGHRK